MNRVAFFPRAMIVSMAHLMEREKARDRLDGSGKAVRIEKNKSNLKRILCIIRCKVTTGNIAFYKVP